MSAKTAIVRVMKTMEQCVEMHMALKYQIQQNQMPRGLRSTQGGKLSLLQYIQFTCIIGTTWNNDIGILLCL